MLQIVNVILFQAQRNNEDVDSIKPLFSVDVEHRVSTCTKYLLIDTTFLNSAHTPCINLILCFIFRVHGAVTGFPLRSWLLLLALFCTMWHTALKVRFKRKYIVSDCEETLTCVNHFIPKFKYC